jgi:hypothetical protein
MTSTLKAHRTTFWQPLAIATAIGLSLIAPAKAQNGSSIAPFSLAVQLDLSDVQTALQDELEALHQEDPCGASWNITEARVVPGPNGRTIRVNFRGRVAQTQCTYTRRPLAHREGPRTRFHSRDEIVRETTTANHVSFAIEVAPRIVGNSFELEGKIATADATGTLDRLKLGTQIKDLVTDKLIDAVEGRVDPTIFSGLVRGNQKLGEVTFVDIGKGKLGMTLKTTGRIRVPS